jgi:hypothetical protein
MIIWERARAALVGIGLPVAANTIVVASGSDYPDQYLVYQMISNPPLLHGDDVELVRRYRMQVNFFSRTGLDSIPAQIETAMLAAGFTRLEGREIPYNQDTRHFGLSMDFNYLED